MAKNSVAGLLTSVDELFTTQEIREEAKLERVIDLPPDEISDFPDHPFKVRMDEEMLQMIESVKQHGVLVPALIRPKPEGGFQMIAGHRRKHAAKLTGFPKIPCIVRDLTDEEATIVMVDSNLQREKILPSERAFAYKMRLNAMRRMAGRPKRENYSPLGNNFQFKTSSEELAETVGESKNQIFRYIRLTELIPEILELVDNSVLKEKDKLQMALRPAVELSYLKKEEQEDLFQAIQDMDCTPSHVQAIKMRQFSQQGRLDSNVIFSILEEEKPNQKEQFKIPKERISKYFAPGTPVQKIEDTIVKALEFYRKRQRSMER
ncbi:ParB/RepB/Spo0J family partition protein [Massiliimalia timonensis]|uniref:ParB/RepB/Spo0J family partition protein n=1 Tax=Massiliimalia timonensis TaxID=1987501 RepID=UPI00189F5585|nr:ParB/RepB/Spo0J family partition protein [Massiliimalia timonensis]